VLGLAPFSARVISRKDSRWALSFIREKLSAYVFLDFGAADFDVNRGNVNQGKYKAKDDGNGNNLGYGYIVVFSHIFLL